MWSEHEAYCEMGKTVRQEVEGVRGWERPGAWLKESGVQGNVQERDRSLEVIGEEMKGASERREGQRHKDSWSCE